MAQAQVKSTALEGLETLARLYHANGFTAEAEQCWVILQRAQPAEARWYYLLADLRRTAGDQDAYEKLLRQVVDRNPDYAPAWQQLAELAFKSGRWSAAEQGFQTRLRLLPGDPYATLGLARISLQRGERDAARASLADLVQRSPDFPPAHNLYAELLAADGHEAAARHHRWQGREAGRFRDPPDPWLQALTDACLDPRRLRVFGTIAYQVNDLTRAEQLMRRALELAPADLDTHVLLGDLLLNTDRPDEARIVYERAAAMRVANAPPATLFVNLSEAYRRLRQPGEALRVLGEGLDRLPDAFELYNARGVTLGALGRHEDALTAYREALERNPNDADTNFNRAISLLELERKEEARDAFLQALTAQPTFPKALFFLARLEMEDGNLDGARTFLFPLYESHPEQEPVRKLVAQWHLGAGLAATRVGDPVTAEKHYRAGLEAEPDTASLHASLGVLCLNAARPREALQSFVRFRELEPNNTEALLLQAQALLQLNQRQEAKAVLRDAETSARRAGRDDLLARIRHFQQLGEQPSPQ